MKLFDDINNDVISTEMITKQIDDPFVKEAVSIMDSMYELYKTDPEKYGKGNFNSKEYIRDDIKKLTKLITERFGFNCKINHDEDVLMAVMSIITEKGTILTKYDPALFYGLLEEYLKTTMSKKDKNRKLYVDLLTSYKSLEETLKTDKVIVDWKKAKITGLPKTYNINLFTNFPILFDMELSSTEIVAVLLHEIGHAFTHLSYVYRTARNTTGLINALRDSIDNEKDPYKTLVMTWEELGGDKDEIKDKDVNTIFLKIITSLPNKISVGKTNHHASIDSEYLADQFVARFGLGGAIVTGLNKVNQDNELWYFLMMLERMRMFMLIGFLISTLLLMVITVITGPTAALTTAYIFDMGVLLATFVGTPLLKFMRGLAYTTKDMTYDTTIKRYERLRLEAIRQIRTLDLNRKEKANLIASCDAIKNVLDLQSQNTVTLGKLIKILSSTDTQNKEQRFRLEEELEKLMENDLHMYKTKLELVNK